MGFYLQNIDGAVRAYTRFHDAVYAKSRLGTDAGNERQRIGNNDSRLTSRYRLPEPQAFDLPDFDATYDWDNRVATWNTAAVTHDADGNMTAGPLPGVVDFTSYNFDARNRLSGVGGTTYQYDADEVRQRVDGAPIGVPGAERRARRPGAQWADDEHNNRIGKTDAAGTTNYIIDPHGDALPRVLVREKPDGLLTYYVYGIGLLYEVDESNVTTSYHFDQSGSTVALTDDTGTVTDRVEYSPFGTVTHRTGTTDTPYLYAGQFGIQQDANGLLYMRARYYSPELQRFINTDPTGFEGGLNWYAYANNSPLIYIDPTGEVPVLVIAAIIYLGTSPFLNSPGPDDPTFAGNPMFEEALFAASVPSGIGPAASFGKTIVGTALSGSRSFMNILTGPVSSASVRSAGTMGFTEANIGMSLLTQASSHAATNASRQFASKAITYAGVYSAGTFVGGGITGLVTPTDASNLFSSGNPLLFPFEAGNLTGSLAGDSYDFFRNSFRRPTGGNLPTSSSFK